MLIVAYVSCWEASKFHNKISFLFTSHKWILQKHPTPHGSQNHMVLHVELHENLLLYSWRFPRYSAPIHWLDHGGTTSNNETVSRRMPWAGNILKTMTGNSSLLPAKCWPLLHVMAGISARFSNFAFVLFCHITNHLVTGPLGNSEFCFPWISMFPSTILWKQNSLFPSGPVIKC